MLQPPESALVQTGRWQRCVESIVRDLESEKPIWPLSSYGPAKLQPTLIANLDESPEELRVKAAEAARKGTVQEYLTYEAEKISAAQAAHTNARSNVQALHNHAVKNFEAYSLGGTPTPFGTAPPGAASAFGGGTTSA
ncbi:hypothetical protein FKP32DRAFT_1681336, partial [Trametes sanguinea]